MRVINIGVSLLLGMALFLIAPTHGRAAANALHVFSESGGQYSSFLAEAPTFVNALSLAANVAESFTIPSGATRVVFSSTCNFYARVDATATVPGDTTDGTAAMLNPSGWGLRDVTSISVIAPTTCVVTGAFYK